MTHSDGAHLPLGPVHALLVVGIALPPTKLECARCVARGGNTNSDSDNGSCGVINAEFLIILVLLLLVWMWKIALCG